MILFGEANIYLMVFYKQKALKIKMEKMCDFIRLLKASSQFMQRLYRYFAMIVVISSFSTLYLHIPPMGRGRDEQERTFGLKNERKTRECCWSDYNDANGIICLSCSLLFRYSLLACSHSLSFRRRDFC